MNRPPRDRGSVSIMVAICLVAVVLFIGLSVDGGGQLRDAQLANGFAAEAARAAGQKIDLQVAIAGKGPVLDTTKPCLACPYPYVKAAKDYLRSAAAEDQIPQNDIASTVTPGVNPDGTATVTVTVTITYSTYLLGAFGFAKTLQATGSATADLEPAP